MVQTLGHFTEGVDFAYEWRCIGKGLRLQPVQQACFQHIIIIVAFHSLGPKLGAELQ